MMTDATLIEIVPGLWVRPELVSAIRTTREVTRDTFTLKATCTIHLPGCGEIGWEFEKWQDAQAWAAKIALAINDLMRARSTTRLAMPTKSDHTPDEGVNWTGQSFDE